MSGSVSVQPAATPSPAMQGQPSPFAGAAGGTAGAFLALVSQVLLQARGGEGRTPDGSAQGAAPLAAASALAVPPDAVAAPGAAPATPVPAPAIPAPAIPVPAAVAPADAVPPLIETGSPAVTPIVSLPNVPAAGADAKPGAKPGDGKLRARGGRNDADATATQPAANGAAAPPSAPNGLDGVPPPPVTATPTPAQDKTVTDGGTGAVASANGKAAALSQTALPQAALPQAALPQMALPKTVPPQAVPPQAVPPRGTASPASGPETRPVPATAPPDKSAPRGEGALAAPAPSPPMPPRDLPAAPEVASVSRPAHEAPAAPAAQIAPALVSVLRSADGAQEVTVRLDPADLGHVQIRVEHTAEGTARVSITAERPETLQLLVRDQPRLEQVLDRAGIPSDGRDLNFQVAAPSPVHAGASRQESFDAGGGGSGPSLGGEGRGGEGRGGEWRQDGDPTRDPGSDPGSAHARTRARWLRTGLDITA